MAIPTSSGAGSEVTPFAVITDQCTGANPRCPLMSEIKETYLKAYYGK